jgi:adenosylhomocysteine nucleosidase
MAVAANDKDYLTGLLQQNPLFVFALHEEAGEEFGGESLLFTGVGKVNATYSLTKQLAATNCSIVVNLGSAGSSFFRKGSIICCNQFVQRDMNVTALGFDAYKTPYSADEVIIQYGLEAPDLPKGICGSGDNFETDHQPHVYNVVDMEAYSLAIVCMRENIPFLCLKYITDGGDSDASTDWQTSLHKVAMQLKSCVAQLRS